MDGLLDFLGLSSATAGQSTAAAAPFGTGFGAAGEYGMSTPTGEVGMSSGGGLLGGATTPSSASWFDQLGQFARSPAGQATRSALGTIGGGGQTNPVAPTLNRQLGPAFTVPTATDPLAGLMQSINAKRARLASLGVGGSYA